MSAERKAAAAWLLFAAMLAGESAKVTDSDKLKIREAQLARVATQLALTQAQAAEQGALAELSKKLGCEINPQTIECVTPSGPAAARAGSPGPPPDTKH